MERRGVHRLAVGVAPGVQHQVRVGVERQSAHRMQQGDEVALRLGLGFGERCGSAIGLGRHVRARASVVVAPLEAVVAVQVDAIAVGVERAAELIVARVLAPHPKCRGVRVGVLVDLVAVGIDERHEVDAPLVEQVSDERVAAVLGDQVVSEVQHRLHSARLARVRERVVKRHRARVGARDLLAKLQPPDRLALPRVADGIDLVGDDVLRVTRDQVVELLLDLGAGPVAAHAARAERRRGDTGSLQRLCCRHPREVRASNARGSQSRVRVEHTRRGP